MKVKDLIKVLYADQKLHMVETETKRVIDKMTTQDLINNDYNLYSTIKECSVVHLSHNDDYMIVEIERGNK